MAARGLYRDTDGWAYVVYDEKNGAPIPRERYEENGYEPDFNDLPTKAEYDSAQSRSI